MQGSGASQVKQLFSYDANGDVVSINYNGTEYYYLRNGQTDIVGLMDGSGNRVVEYTYDAWGKLISTTGTLASTLGADNPFRYRGYYYDTETGLYYLMTRYYDPEVCRFISADVYMTTGQGVLGGNMWAYCGNSPVNRYDDGGTFWNIVVGAALGTIVGAVTAAINGQNVLAGAAAGLVSGTLAGVGLGVGLAVAAGASAAIGTGAVAVAAGLGIAAGGGAIGGAAGEVINQVANGQERDVGAIIREATIGALFNVVGFGLGSLTSMAFKAPDITGMGIIKGMKTTTAAMSVCEKVVSVHVATTLVSIPQAATSYVASHKKLTVRRSESKRTAGGSMGYLGKVAMAY
ncbi:MAG: RHS repeat-associated core domain-containing protein [Christensenellales bacterium]